MRSVESQPKGMSHENVCILFFVCVDVHTSFFTHLSPFKHRHPSEILVLNHRNVNSIANVSVWTKWMTPILSVYFNPFVPNAPFLYPLKICFQGVEKGCIGNEWVNCGGNKFYLVLAFYLKNEYI